MGIYQCQNKGCPNGAGSSFELSDKEEAFYAEHGLSSPKNCPECRIWRKEQTKKYTITCEACGNTRIITPEKRISHHRKTGPWSDPTLCRLCEEDPNRELLERNRALSDIQWLDLRRQASPAYPNRSGKNYDRIDKGVYSQYVDSNNGGILSNPQPFDVLEDAEVYKNLHDRANGNALNHITKPGHMSYEKLGTNDGQTLILMASEIAHSANNEDVTQFQDSQSGYAIKRDNLTGQVVVIKPYEGPPPEYRVVTTYQVGDDQMIRKVESGIWIPSR